MYVLMISPNNFPNGDAGAVRDECFAKIYQQLGYEVMYIGMGTERMNGEWKNIKFTSLFQENNTLQKKISNLISYKRRLQKKYENYERKYGKPSVIHIYDIPEAGIKWAIKKAEILNIPILHDSVEWYSPCEFKYGKFSYPYILKNRTNTKLIKKPISVIAISTYLEKYYKNKGLNTTRIPVIMDSEQYKVNEYRNSDKYKLIYAGSPSTKDYLGECIKAFIMLPDNIRQKFEFNIYGVDTVYVEKFCENGIPNELRAFGRVTRETVIEALRNSDFSLLLRPENERYTRAGFPTKSVEAMMNGCAMICNLTSDLGLYLENNYNAIIVPGCKSKNLYDTFLQIADKDVSEIDNIKKAARKTAEEYYDYRKYILLVKELINA